MIQANVTHPPNATLTTAFATSTGEGCAPE
jgi:hypothetical protein